MLFVVVVQMSELEPLAADENLNGYQILVKNTNEPDEVCRLIKVWPYLNLIIFGDDNHNVPIQW